MAETALSKQMDSDKPERACAWCGADISQRHHAARFCGKACFGKARWQAEKVRVGPVISNCKVCGAEFKKVRSAVTCSQECSDERHKATSRRWRKDHPKRSAEITRNWRKKNHERAKKLKNKNYASDPERHRSYYKKWREENLKEQRARERSVHRHRAAEQALALLIMPIENQETNQ